MGSWKGLAKRREQFAALDAQVIGLAVDPPARLAAFRKKHHLPYTMLSDPQLTSEAPLSIPTSRGSAFAATAVLHPVILTYPRKAFFQPALLVWLRDGTLHYEWRQTSKLTNLLGARGRPTGDEIVAAVRDALAGK